MDTFKRINWQTPLENIIDDIFIRDERMERDSATYKILNGIFTDPFGDDIMEEDYANVDIEKIKLFTKGTDNLDKEGEECEQKIKNVNKNKKISKKKREDHMQIDKKCYTPGLKKQPIDYPRESCLNRMQHAVCLRVLLQLFNDKKKPITKEEKEELDAYMSLQQLISEEQKEFLEYTKTRWSNTAKVSIKCNRYIIRKWKSKMQNLQQLPRYYVESANVPFSLDKQVLLKFRSYLQQESFPEIILPKLDSPCFLNVGPSPLLKKCPVLVISDKTKQHFRLPVSEDAYCEKFAETSKADLVISSSGLKCLLNNIDPTYSNAWIIPIVIKTHHGKNVAYIDKKLPPIAATAPQKNTWVYKHILRYVFVYAEDKLSDTATSMEENASKDIICSNSKDEDEHVNDHLKDYEEDLYMSDIENDTTKVEDIENDATKVEDIENDATKVEDIENDATKVEDSSMDRKKNVTYSLFTIGLESQDQCNLKQDTKEYQILVRTKIDGVEMLPSGESRALVLAPKMEHQLQFGAEATSLEEGVQQWASLICRPDASLARVRIAADTGEVIQIEKHTAMTLSDEIKRLHDAKVADSLKILYNIIEKLSSLTPGRYIMRHTGSNGPFLYIYKETEECGKNLDLHATYKSEMFHTIPITPWPPIDTMIVTPALKVCNRMPATFFPKKHNVSKMSNVIPILPQSKKLMKKRNTNVQEGPIRRSLREKKPRK